MLVTYKDLDLDVDCYIEPPEFEGVRVSVCASVEICKINIAKTNITRNFCAKCLDEICDVIAEKIYEE